MTTYIYRLKIDYVTMQCAILFKTTAEYKSQQRSKLYRLLEIYSPTYYACVFLLTWATMKDTVIVAIESNSFEFTL